MIENCPLCGKELGESQGKTMNFYSCFGNDYDVSSKKQNGCNFFIPVLPSFLLEGDEITEDDLFELINDKKIHKVKSNKIIYLNDENSGAKTTLGHKPYMKPISFKAQRVEEIPDEVIANSFEPKF